MSNLNRILVGIRDSKLSRTQTNILLNQLVSVSSEITNESFVIKTIKTKGDIHNEKRLDQIGGKGSDACLSALVREDCACPHG